MEKQINMFGFKKYTTDEIKIILDHSHDLKNYDTNHLAKQVVINSYNILTAFDGEELKKAHDKLVDKNNAALVPTDLDSILDKVDHDVLYRHLLIAHVKLYMLN